MKILYILIFQGLSKPISGGQTRFLNITNEISRKGHSPVILEGQHVLDPADTFCAKILTYKDLVLRGKNFAVLRDLNPSFIRAASNAIRIERPDIVQVSHPAGAISLKLMMCINSMRMPLILDLQNVESDYVAETSSGNSNYPRLERLLVSILTIIMERLVCRFVADHIIVVSEEDRFRLIKKHHLKPEKVVVIPSGCRIDGLTNRDERMRVRNELAIPENKTVVVFHGSFAYEPNRKAFEVICRTIAPKFEKDDVLFLIGGAGFPIYEDRNVRSLGFLNSLRGFLAAADIAIVPLLRGGGTKLKMFDYMSMGLPILTTSKGAQGIKIKSYFNAIVADNISGDFVMGLDFLIRNTEERIRIGGNARATAEREYDWSVIGDRLNRLYLEIEEESRCSPD